MMSVKELKTWLNTLSDEEFVAIDEGGLILCTDSRLARAWKRRVAYLKVGRWPEEEVIWTHLPVAAVFSAAELATGLYRFARIISEAAHHGRRHFHVQIIKRADGRFQITLRDAEIEPRGPNRVWRPGELFLKS